MFSKCTASDIRGMQWLLQFFQQLALPPPVGQVQKQRKEIRKIITLRDAQKIGRDLKGHVKRIESHKS